ncbi:MAG: 3D domain-containing protein [Candidatus Krumholzibacteria bacterium]|nr:3D domain-containing protein [Candidatus Krumholzibacteria bacterium]MDH4337072.1 3D domain-containing protein [Candidatus Krumholzibacteria bacterium]MDH5268609.1 3D domain-containing protein [Candidatus Krumholzibacteria bacterium]
MKKRIAWSACLWRLRTGSFGFYVDGPARALFAAGRSLPPAARRARRNRAFVLVAAVAIGVPALLWISDLASSSRIAARTGLAEGRPVAEVASLEGSLERYYRQREAGEWEGELSGREVAVTVTVTGYTSRPEETDDTPFITAANTQTRPGVIALSRDLLRRYTPDAPFTFGDVIHISGVGDFVVEDSMNSRWRKRADIWFESLSQARSFGRRTLVVTGPYGLADGQELDRPTFLASTKAGASK